MRSTATQGREAVVRYAVERARRVQGMMSDAELVWIAEHVAALPKDALVVEVGTFRGRTARAMVEAIRPGGVVACCDHFLGSDEESDIDPTTGDRPKRGTKQYLPEMLHALFTREFNEELRPPRVRLLLLPFPSLTVARWLADGIADMVFVDGSHTYENVRADLVAWRPKLKPGGLFCGHNCTTDCPGVERACDELLPGWRREVGQIWSWRASSGAGGAK